VIAGVWKERINRWLEGHAGEVKAMYGELHELAEIGWQEHRTTAYICEQLSMIGLEVRTFAEHTGAIGRWSGSDGGRIVALRADIDALWQLVGGEWRANHSCGHDAHMTMVFSAMRCLKEIGYQVSAGELRAVFQPAEEPAEGAKALLRSGALDDVNCMLGIHLRPQKELGLGQASSAIYHGGVAELSGRIRGRQAHAARPEDGINAIETLAAIVTAIQTIRENPANGGSCKVTTVRVPNESVNIIPDDAEFKVDIRASTHEELARLAMRVQQAAAEAGAASGAEVETKWAIKAAPAIPNAEMERVIGKAISLMLGTDSLAEPVVTPGAEDFHFYPMERGSLKATMIGLGSGLVPGLHHPDMYFDHEALMTGTAILAMAAIQLLEGE
jgi:amidohydrolase